MTTPDAATVPVARSGWMPPRFLLVYGLAGVATHFALGGPVLLRQPGVGGLLVVAGCALAVWGARTFAAVGTTIKPFEPSHVVVTHGPFRFSRNPMYLSMVAILAGVALLLGTAGPWLATLAHAATLRWRFIANEERALEASIGEPYLRYRRSVRRWL